MERITSTKNPYIQELRSLKQKKHRQALGKFIAEGGKCALEALEYAQVESLLVLDEDAPAVRRALAADVRVYLVSRAVLEAVSDAKTPQPVLAVVRKSPGEWQPEPGLYVALEDVADPQNVGTIIRTADAAGAKGVLLSAGTADHTGPRAVRAAMGSLFHLDIAVREDFYDCLAQLKERGILLVAGHLEGEEAAPGRMESACVLIGNEARGLSERAVMLADRLYRIPIHGKAESLNAAVAAGILLYRCREGW